MVLFALAALGLGIGYGLWGPDWGLVDWLAANSDYILYLLMFSVGISVGMHHGLWNKLKQYHIKILVVPAGIVVGGVLADAIISLGRRSNAKSIAAFAVWTLCFWLGQQSMVFFAGDAYVDMVVQSGMSAEYGQALVGFMQSPLIVVAGIACVVGAVVGGVLGAKLFRKHFSKLAA